MDIWEFRRESAGMCSSTIAGKKTYILLLKLSNSSVFVDEIQKLIYNRLDFDKI